MKNIVTILLFLITSIMASEKARELSNYKPIGRLEREDRCTATLVGDACVITAGHCLFYDDYIELGPPEYVEFNVPHTKRFMVQTADPKDIYRIDFSYYIANTSNLYGEFGVMKLRPNQITKRLAGEVQGHLPIAKNKPLKGSAIRITGFGVSKDPNKHYSQKTMLGILTSDDYLKYANTFTTHGDSGSAVVFQQTGEIIGIHTTSDTKPGTGFGTYLVENLDFLDAVSECLADPRY